MENRDEPATGTDEGYLCFIPKKDQALPRVVPSSL